MKLSRNFKYLKANSLIESVIAIAIISICILVAFLVYLNVIRQNKSIDYYEAKHQVESLYNQALITNDFENESFNYGHYTIDKNIDISEDDWTVRLEFKIKTSNNAFTINKLVKLKHNETN